MAKKTEPALPTDWDKDFNWPVPEELDNLGGRPRKDITLRDAYVWGCMQTSEADMAALAGCSRSTIQDRMRDEDFRAYYDQGQAEMKSSLKRKQLAKAFAGDTALLIFLGKALLGQREVNVLEVEDITRRSAQERAKAQLNELTEDKKQALRMALLIDEQGHVISE